ncbi:MAG: NAD(P)H-binding protein [Pseudomonadales bacterium]|nr:NAD(P)H-binding protein [Pseudomonadales bacterium]
MSTDINTDMKTDMNTGMSTRDSSSTTATTHPISPASTAERILVTGGTGKTGHRVTRLLLKQGRKVRSVGRQTPVPMSWYDERTWQPALQDITAVYIAFSPDLAVPGTPELISRFVTAARTSGVQRVVLLSGRGEEEAQGCEQIIMNSGMQWTVIRSAWFAQNFSEGDFSHMVDEGVIMLPAAGVPEPFVDIDDLAEVAVAALTQAHHHGQIYDVTGPELLSFEEVARLISAGTGRAVSFFPVSQAAFTEGLAGSGAPDDFIWLLNYLFTEVLDGRNAHTGDGVMRALGRAPGDFRTFVSKAIQSGEWKKAA